MVSKNRLILVTCLFLGALFITIIGFGYVNFTYSVSTSEDLDVNLIESTQQGSVSPDEIEVIHKKITKESSENQISEFEHGNDSFVLIQNENIAQSVINNESMPIIASDRSMFSDSTKESINNIDFNSSNLLIFTDLIGLCENMHLKNARVSADDKLIIEFVTEPHSFISMGCELGGRYHNSVIEIKTNEDTTYDDVVIKESARRYPYLIK